jgi:hypothetical protein
VTRLQWPDPRTHADGETVTVSGTVGRVVLDATSAGAVWADFELLVEDVWPRVRCLAFPTALAGLGRALEPGLVVTLRGRISLGGPHGPEMHVAEWRSARV